MCDEVPWQVVAITAAWILRDGLQSLAISAEQYAGSEALYDVEIREPFGRGGAVTKGSIVKKGKRLGTAPREKDAHT